jgi:hypothetical protein
MRGSGYRTDDLVTAIRGKVAPHIAAEHANLAAERLAGLSEQVLRRSLAKAGFSKEVRLSFAPLISKRRPLAQFSEAARAGLPPYLPVRMLNVDAAVGNARAQILVVVGALWSPELIDSGVVPELNLAIADDREGGHEVWMRDVEPVATQSLLSRLDLWASRAAALLAARVNEAL